MFHDGLLGLRAFGRRRSRARRAIRSGARSGGKSNSCASVLPTRCRRAAVRPKKGLLFLGEPVQTGVKWNCDRGSENSVSKLTTLEPKDVVNLVDEPHGHASGPRALSLRERCARMQP